MHCGYVFFLSLVLWAELAARVLPKDPDMQSIVEDLEAALMTYSSVLQTKSNLGNLESLACKETAAHLEQSSTVAERLSKYQMCVEKPGSFCPDVNALCRVVRLNGDLLQHLNGPQLDSARCLPSAPPFTSTPSPPDFNSISKSIRCVHCWRQQVEALRK